MFDLISKRLFFSFTGPWLTSKVWKVQDSEFRRVTACAVDPYGRFLVVGNQHDQLAVVCSKTGRILNKPFEFGYPLNEQQPISCVACAVPLMQLSTDSPDITEYRCVAGTSNGKISVSFPYCLLLLYA